MAVAVFDFFRTGELPAPVLSTDGARAVAAELGFEGVEVTALGSQQDANFLLRPSDPRVGDPVGVLKVTNPAFSADAVDLQDRAAMRVAAAGLRAPTRIAGPTEHEGSVVRVIEFLGGGTLTGSRYLRPAAVARLGALCAQVGSALADLEHPHLAAVLQWNLQHGLRTVRELAHHLPADLHERLMPEAELAGTFLERLGDLPVQPIHGDLTDDNVVCDAAGLPDGVIDFGDVTRSWRVAELAVAISSVLHHDGATVAAVLPAVAAYDALTPLTDDELAALWPMVVLRAGTLVVSGHQQVALDPANAYAAEGLVREQRIWDVATSVPMPVVFMLLLHHLGRPVPAPTLTGSLLPAGTEVEVLDVSVTSPVMDEGGWLDPRVHVRGLTVAPFGVVDARLIPPFALDEPATTRLRAALYAPEPQPLVAPWSGTVLTDGEGLLLLDDQRALVLLGGATGTDGPVEAGAPLGTAAGLVEVSCVPHDLGLGLPAWAPASQAPGWLAVLPDVNPLFGIQTPIQAPDPMPRRAAALAGTQEHYYAHPPRIERGWRHFLLSTEGRSYLDILNNVTVLGHGRPDLADAAARQWRLLNTNSRFHYEAIATFAERLTALLPASLDTVYLVNSGSEAVDLALRLATIATGRPDVVAVREAYHGWTYLSDAVSTSTADNPRALETRPSWVHTVESPNAFRGRYRGAEAAHYARDAVRVIDELVAAGTPPAAFIAEAFYGNAGGIALPDEYLREVYAAVRAAGGLAVADEIQVGLGRLGHWFWGFEQQGVVPDIVAVAKALGNGHPVAAVVTTREVAERYADEGYFFSSTGGSPVSSVIGSTVLDALVAEDLPGNARVVGGRLRAGLESLMDRHPIIGAVHGSGFYLGVEFVRSRDTLEPATAETALICDRMLELGVIVQPTGDHQNVLKIKPPMCLDAEAADFFVAALDRALTTGW